MSETSGYHRVLGPLRANKPATPDRDVVMTSPRSGLLPPPNRPLFSSDEFIPFSLDGEDPRSHNKKRRERGEEDLQSAKFPAWIDPKVVDVSMLSLGTELNHFYRWISLTDEENNLREHAVQLLTDIVKTLWPAARVEVFGSHFTKISLPSSDVDLMIYNVRVDDPLSQICYSINSMHSEDFVLVKLIPGAKMPLLKLTTKLGEVKLDVCIATRDEPPNSVKIAQYLSQMPVLRPLVVILKQFLQQYLLNDTYTGGAGSYLLTLMSISLLQFRENPHSPLFLGTGGSSVSHFGKSQDLGAILLEFFELYGKIFNYHKHGISVRDHGSYFTKHDRGWLMPHAPHLLSIEDPSDQENDVGRGSFNMMQVRVAFFQAFARLTHPETERVVTNTLKVSTLLTRVIEVDDIYVKRRLRAKTIGASLQKKRAPETPDKKSFPTSPSSPSIMVGDKNLADEDAPTLPNYSSPSTIPPMSISTPPLNSSSSSTPPTTLPAGSPIDIDSPEVEVIEIDPPSPPSSSQSSSSLHVPSLIPLPSLPGSTSLSVPTISSIPSPNASIFRPTPSSTLSTSPNSLRSTSPGSLRSTSPGSLHSISPSSTGLSTSPNQTPSKAYSNGISNVIVNNHSRSPNGPSHYFTPNPYPSNFGFNYNNIEKTKEKKGKFRPTAATTNTTTTTTTSNPPTFSTTTATTTNTTNPTTITTAVQPTNPTTQNTTANTNKNVHKNSNKNNNNNGKKNNKKKFNNNKEQHHPVYRPKNPPTATTTTTTSSTPFVPTTVSDPFTSNNSTTPSAAATIAAMSVNSKINSNMFSPGKRRKFESSE